MLNLTKLILIFLAGNKFLSICVLSEMLPCALKEVGPEKYVCVCNETYCDQLDDLKFPVPKGNFILYTSNKGGLRMTRRDGMIHPNNGFEILDARRVKLIVNTNEKHQKVLGFGGAFTDAAGFNIRDLSVPLQNTLIRSYYGPEGIGYSLGRIPMGGTDFSTRPYTYDDNNTDDIELSKFSLQEEDYTLKVPYIKLAQALNPDILFYGSPWSAPGWMKSNNNIKGRGILLPQYNQVWADYFVKFLNAYKQEGIPFWGVTTQNEPIDGLVPFFPFNSMGWTPLRQRNWIAKNLGPTLHENGFKNVKIIILDDNSVLLPYWPKKILADSDAAKYISGIGLHWYSNSLTKYSVVNKTSRLFPEKFLLATEACEGFFPWQIKVDLGSWERAENYAEDIIRDLRSGVVGWTDWNLALNLEGGPNWANLGADSPIIVNKLTNEFYKQPMFYALAHIAKFFIRYSDIVLTEVRSGNQLLSNNLFTVAALRPDRTVVVAFLNRNEFDVQVDLWDADRGSANFTLTAKSIATLIYS